MRISPVVRKLGLVNYMEAWQSMRRFTESRTEATPDEIWILEHPPVFTLGLGGKQEHIHDRGAIPVVHSDRGGQVTYHGPGQLIVYLLLDLQRRRCGVKRLISLLEDAVIMLCAEWRIDAKRRPGAPGVYIEGAKLASVGLRIKHNRSYHGLALNVDMDLSPFACIDPCGFPGLKVTQLRDQGVESGMSTIKQKLINVLLTELSNFQPQDPLAVPMPRCVNGV